MTPHYASELVTLYAGDCIQVMRGMPDSSVDAVVTDPPYGLEFMGREWDAPWKEQARAASATVVQAQEVGGFQDGAGGNAFSRSRVRTNTQRHGGDSQTANAGFQAWCEVWATQALRVLKPGGHLVAFGGSRTWHRLASAIEDSGFEVRDSIAWLYGSGFPKSLDVAKAIDKQRDDVEDIRHVCRWLRASIDASTTHTLLTLAEYFGFNRRMVEHWAARDTDSQPTLPTWEQWRELGVLLGFGDEMDAEVWRLNGRKGEPGEDYANAEVLGEHAGQQPGFMGERFRVTDRLVRAPGSGNSAAWKGWGTALKPSFEPIVVGRKPLAGTVAANVLAHGTGALNIDGCRTAGLADRPGTTPPSTGERNSMSGDLPRQDYEPNSAGRWPANVILDPSQALELDRQSGVLTSGANPTRRGADGDRQVLGAFGGQEAAIAARGADSGGASRFFPTFHYEAKASQSERPKDGDTAHPTVKPLDLMRWLVRLVTPPGGTVLEPFAGSGTTAEACVIEGFNCIAIEREPTYLPLIVARLSKPIQPSMFGGAA